MPSRDDYDDYGPPRRRRSSLPSAVRAAGIIWIGIGILGILGSVLGLIGRVADAGAGGGGAGAPGGNPFCATGCSLIIPLVFLMVGIQTVKGTAKGTLGNGIGSIVFGHLSLG